MNKRGQLTLFIIIAIVIVTMIVFIILFQKGFLGNISESDTTKIKLYIDDCLKLKTKQGLLILGKQGGYYSFDSVKSINFLNEQTAYYWKDEENLVPSRDVIEQELNSWLDDNIASCFILEEYNIITENCSTDSKIEDTVAVSFNCPITIKKGSTTSKIGSFTTEFDFPTPKFLDVSFQVITEYAKKPGYLNIDVFDEIATENNITLTIVPITKEVFEPEHIWFLITDKNIKFEEQNITWRFVTDM